MHMAGINIGRYLPIHTYIYLPYLPSAISAYLLLEKTNALRRVSKTNRNDLPCMYIMKVINELTL